MGSTAVRLHRWDEIALEKVTEMLSRKIVSGEREMLVQVYVKRGCLVPMHAHDSEQMTYVLQGALKFLVGGEEITVREGEVLHIPSGVEHQAEALEDTFELDVFSPIRQEWLGAAYSCIASHSGTTSARRLSGPRDPARGREAGSESTRRADDRRSAADRTDEGAQSRRGRP